MVTGWKAFARSLRILKRGFNINWARLLSHPDGVKATIDFANGTDSRTAYADILKDYNHPLIRDAISIGGIHHIFSMPTTSMYYEKKRRRYARAALKRRKLI